MSSSHLLTGASGQAANIEIRRIAPTDVLQALAQGLDDFAAMPSHAVFLCVIYPLIGLWLISLVSGYSLLPLAFPIAAGFALIGPFAAIGLYELSRRREAGLDTSSSHAFDVLHSPSIGAIVAMGLLLTAIFLVWLAVAHAIYVANFGYTTPASIRQFVTDVFTTRPGWTLIVVGTGVGFLFAVLVLTISAISFPLAARSGRRRSGRAVHIDPRGRRQSGIDGVVGSHCRRAAGGRLAAVLSRSDGRDAGARPRDLAPLSQGGRAGFCSTIRLSTAGLSAAGAAAPLCGGFSGFALPDATLARLRSRRIFGTRRAGGHGRDNTGDGWYETRPAPSATRVIGLSARRECLSCPSR